VPVSYVATQADIDSNGGGDGTIDNTATVISDQTAPLADSASVSLAGCPLQPPVEVQNLSLDRESTVSAVVTLSWDPVADAEAYNLYGGSQPDLTGLSCLASDLAQTSAQDDGSPPSPLQVYLVTATNCAGESTAGPTRSIPAVCP
jgi:hypothetical protein